MYNVCRNCKIAHKFNYKLHFYLFWLHLLQPSKFAGGSLSSTQYIRMYIEIYIFKRHIIIIKCGSLNMQHNMLLFVFKSHSTHAFLWQRTKVCYKKCMRLVWSDWERVHVCVCACVCVFDMQTKSLECLWPVQSAKLCDTDSSSSSAADSAAFRVHFVRLLFKPSATRFLQTVTHTDTRTHNKFNFNWQRNNNNRPYMPGWHHAPSTVINSAQLNPQ